MTRTVLCALLACAAVFAQDSTPASGNNAAADSLQKRLQDLEDKLKAQGLVRLDRPVPAINAPVAAAPKVCAIPLLQVFPAGTTDRMHVVTPSTPVLRGDTVQVPAPACTNWNANVTSPVFRQPAVR